jgi:adenylate cyclase
MILSVLLAIRGGYYFGVFDYLEHKTYDFRARLLAGQSRPADDIVVILLDQDSIDWAYQERGWSWPWPRRAYAELVDYMRDSGAKSTIFDVIFSEASVYGPGDDDAFDRASRDFGRVVQAVFFSSQSGKSLTWPAELSAPLFDLGNFDAPQGEFDLLPDDRAAGQIGAQFPIDALRNSAGAIGNITGKTDSDGILRRANLFVLFDNQAVPSLAAAPLLAGGEAPGISYNHQKQAIEWGDLLIPLDDRGMSLLRFRGGLERYVPYSAGDVLKSAEQYGRGEEPLLYPEDFADKYVFFGYYAPGLFDFCSTPISSVYPGVGVHITMLDNMLQGDFIRPFPPWGEFLISLAAITLISLVVSFSGSIPAAVAGGVLVLGGLGGAALGAYQGGYWMPVVAPMAGAALAFVAAILYNYATEGSQRRFIKSAFSQYLSPTVIEQLLAHPEQLSLGGERREISIFFSDVQGFTTISEGLDPSTLTELLNDYLTFMTNIILDSGGTIDKYEGDAIIAFWNAPLNFPDHAGRALGASLECHRRLAERQDFFFEKFGCRLLTRIGLNTGYAVVGNMGSNKHFNYTMLGDSVNLAARLEGLNKQFGTYLMCTENTFTQAARGGAFWGRKLAQVAVVGKKEPVTVYEPLPEELFREQAPLLRRFDEARDAFYRGDFAAALPLFEALTEQGDKPSFFYAGQCRYYQDHPEEWKGFWQATTK